MKCAIYARYSSDLQRESSIEDQVRKCRECAEREGWHVVPEYVVSDEAVSGAALSGRERFMFLIRESKKKPRPFDRILVDDTSRLARNVADALRAVDTLRYYDVGVTFVSQGLDSLQKSTRQVLTFHHMMDEELLRGVADKVHRGQEGRVLNGLNPGGRCYGYVNVPIEDRNRVGKYGRAVVTGVRLEIHEKQGEIVRRVFQMYADGMGLALIAKNLNSEGVPAPQPPRTREMQAWCPSSIREMIRNERYRGVQVWNRTEKTRDPETGRKTRKNRAREDWVRVEVQEWRIVSEDLWNAVQERISVVNASLGRARSGGMNRTERSRKYLFSGLLVCGTCGSRIVIVSGAGKRGYVKYGCPSHRYRGVCDNSLTIRQDRLEEQLLTAIQTRITANPELLDYVLSRFEQELRGRFAELEKEATSSGATLAHLHAERRDVEAKAQRVTEAIADFGKSPALFSQLAALESQIEQMDRRIEAYKPVDVRAAVADVKTCVCKHLMQLRNVLRDDAARARTALAKHIRQLILTPKEGPGGPVYEVSGTVDLALREDADVMRVVARDGLEPPTPAFSGPRSTN